DKPGAREHRPDVGKREPGEEPEEKDGRNDVAERLEPAACAAHVTGSAEAIGWLLMAERPLMYGGAAWPARASSVGATSASCIADTVACADSSKTTMYPRSEGCPGRCP